MPIRRLPVRFQFMMHRAAPSLFPAIKNLCDSLAVASLREQRRGTAQSRSELKDGDHLFRLAAHVSFSEPEMKGKCCSTAARSDSTVTRSVVRARPPTDGDETGIRTSKDYSV
jgi:hypothetical protein